MFKQIKQSTIINNLINSNNGFNNLNLKNTFVSKNFYYKSKFRKLSGFTSFDSEHRPLHNNKNSNHDEIIIPTNNFNNNNDNNKDNNNIIQDQQHQQEEEEKKIISIRRQPFKIKFDESSESSESSSESSSSPTTNTTNTPFPYHEPKSNIISIEEKLKEINQDGVKIKFNTIHPKEHLLNRINKYSVKHGQRQRSREYGQTLKFKRSAGFDEVLEKMKTCYINGNYDSVIREFFSKGRKFELESCRVVIETLKRAKEVGKLNVQTVVDVSLKLAALKHPFHEFLTMLKTLDVFLDSEFHTQYFTMSEPHQITYKYDFIQSLGEEDKNRWNKFQSPGDKHHSRMLHSLIVSNRHAEANKEFERIKPNNITGETIQYVVSGYIEMGYIEKAKLIMSNNFHLRRDENYIVASIELSLAMNDPELAFLLLTNTPAHLKIEHYPPEILQAIILELGKHKKYSTLLEMEKKGLFYRFGIYPDEFSVLLYNAFTEEPTLQKKYYEYIVKARHEQALFKLKIQNKLLNENSIQESDRNSTTKEIVPTIKTNLNLPYLDIDHFNNSDAQFKKKIDRLKIESEKKQLESKLQKEKDQQQKLQQKPQQPQQPSPPPSPLPSPPPSPQPQQLKKKEYTEEERRRKRKANKGIVKGIQNKIDEGFNAEKNETRRRNKREIDAKAEQKNYEQSKLELLAEAENQSTNPQRKSELLEQAKNADDKIKEIQMFLLDSAETAAKAHQARLDLIAKVDSLPTNQEKLDLLTQSSAKLNKK